MRSLFLISILSLLIVIVMDDKVIRSVAAQTDSNVSLPPGFFLEDVVSGLNQSVSFDWTADGRFFIAEQSGVVRVVKNGVLLPIPFVDISDQVNSIGGRGLLGLAVHPGFPTTPYVYLGFSYDPPQISGLTGSGGRDGDGARVSRVLQVSADAGFGFDVALAGSEVVLLGRNSTYANISDPNQQNPTQGSCQIDTTTYIVDCLPADETVHTLGTVKFGYDGALYVSNGDGASFSQVVPYTIRTLSLDSLAGKLLRIDPFSGQGLADNPFYNGDPDSNRSKVYSYGLRNPFRFTFGSLTGEPIIGDVGQSQWEEINLGYGANFGWPCYEGGNSTNLVYASYADAAVCQTLYAQPNAVTPPFYSYPHNPGQESSIQVGDIYRGSEYPVQYQGALFYSDFNRGVIETLNVGANGQTSVGTFAQGIPGITQISAGPDTNLCLINILEGRLQCLRYIDQTATDIARLVTPATDITLTTPRVNFSWRDVGADGYWLEVGASQGSAEYFGQDMGRATSVIVNNLPIDGNPVYVRLWTIDNDVWQDVNYQFATADINPPQNNEDYLQAFIRRALQASYPNIDVVFAPADTPVLSLPTVPRPMDLAEITNPVPDSVLAGPIVMFNWSDVGADGYWLEVGASVGSAEYYGGDQGRNTTVTVTGLPTDGNIIYVRLWTINDGSWQANDYQYTAAAIP